MKKGVTIFLFGIMALILGFIAGFIVWLILNIVNYGISFIWTFIPNKLFNGNRNIFYYLIVCLIGAILIALFQKKHGVLPDVTEEVMDTIKEKGKYPYNNLKTIAVAAILPLLFGGVLGPEAGLVGVIAGLCYWVSDSLKRRGTKLSKLLKKENVSTLEETSTAVVLGIIFKAPLFGIINNIEPDNSKEHYKEKFLSKKGRIFMYVMGVLGGFLAFILFNKLLTLFGIKESSGIPRFDFHRNIHIADWKFFIPLLLVGVLFGIIYILADKYTNKLGKLLSNKRILSCIIVGVCVAVVGYFLPYTMFSGEHQMAELMTDYKNISISILIISALLKLILVNLCINLGWKGGSIFPIIFSGVALGYAFGLIFGMTATFAVAIVVASMYGYIQRKPLTVAAILLLCFPITYIIPIIISAFIASKIPCKFIKKEA